MRRNGRIIYGLAVMAVVALSACGSSAAKSQTTTQPAETTTATGAPTTATTAPAKLDSCALVPLAQAEALIGTKLQPGLHVSTTEIDSCTYPGDPNGPTAQVEVFIGAGAKTYYDDDNNVLHHTFVNVAGLGDESHEEEYALFFRKGTIWVALRVTSLDDWSTFKARTEALAKDLASRI